MKKLDSKYDLLLEKNNDEIESYTSLVLYD